MRRWLERYQSDLYAFFLGVMLSFAFAPYEIFPLAILALAGLFALIYQQSPKRAFSLGFMFGLGLFGAGVSWVYISIHSFGDLPALGAGAITFALIAILSFYPAYVCYASNRYFPIIDSRRFNYAFAVFWVLGEWLRGALFTGFPWLFVGYSQTNSPLSGYAPLLSVYGVTFAALISSMLIVYATMNYMQKQFRTLYSNLFLLIIIWIAGAAFALIPWTQPTDKPVSVSLVQGNIPQSLKWDPDSIKLSFDRYESLTQPLWGKGKIIIWPEAAIPMPLQNATDFIDRMGEMAIRTKSHLILGIPIQNDTQNGYYNALISVGMNPSVYHKKLLVPFGEYIPLQNYFAKAFSIMKIPMANTVPGHMKQKPMKVHGIKILPAICYEIAFPDIMRSTDKTIGMLLTVTNDAWFGKSNAQAQHLQIAAMRAIEMRRPVLFVSNDGITAVINSNGTVLAEAPAHEPFVLNASVQPTYGLTPWMRNGIDPLLFIFICVLFATWQASRIPQIILANPMENE